ncbi:MAG: ATP-binding protein [Gemmatimonadaceae bacterium]
MSALLDTLPCGVVSFTDDGVISYANDTVARTLGYTRDELTGRHVETVLTIAGRIFYQTHFFPLLRLHGNADEIFLLLRTKDGQEVGALVSALRRERDGVIINDCVLLEVRERRKYEDELLRARRAAEAANVELEQQARQLQDQATELEAQHEELQVLNEELMERGEELERSRNAAEDANKAKSQFLATMSHELRTPLNAIGGYVQLVELGIHGPVTDAQLETLARVMRSQRHLLRLINDLLNLARIEAGRVEYRIVPVSAAHLVAGVLPMIEPQMAAATLTLTVTIPAALFVRADREKAEQILINLLTNALKFTPPGGRVTVDAAPDESGVWANIRVADTGIGIKKEKLQSIFEPFVQLQERQTEGSGLGLAISRDLAVGMGGDLHVASEQGRGSIFTLQLASARPA